jgi:hypothetical protein
VQESDGAQCYSINLLAACLCFAVPKNSELEARVTAAMEDVALKTPKRFDGVGGTACLTAGLGTREEEAFREGPGTGTVMAMEVADKMVPLLTSHLEADTLKYWSSWVANGQFRLCFLEPGLESRMCVPRSTRAAGE